MRDRPLVSAIIATYNRAHVVGEAIESILQQTYKNLEVIVVDDGSTDCTKDKLKEYGDRIRIVYQENSGPAAAWNSGIKASQGEIVAFLGSDDIWLPTFVQRHVSLLRRAGESVPCCIANCWLKFGNGKQSMSFDNALLHPDPEEGVWLNVPEVLITRFVVFGQAVTVRRSAIEKVGGFDDTLRYLEDYDMALRLSLLGPWGFIREPLVVWRQGTSQSDSLSQEATRDPVKVRAIALRIHKRVLQQLSSDGNSQTFRKKMTKRLTLDRLNLKAAQLKQTGSTSLKFIGTLITTIDHYAYAVLRRSPRFPTMRTQFVGNAPRGTPRSEILCAKTQVAIINIKHT
jgi:glycosyltransferase involved in cell wall biosynthesis